MSEAPAPPARTITIAGRPNGRILTLALVGLPRVVEPGHRKQSAMFDMQFRGSDADVALAKAVSNRAIAATTTVRSAEAPEIDVAVLKALLQEGFAVTVIPYASLHVCDAPPPPPPIVE